MSSKAYFDQVAQQWDAMHASFFSEAVREQAFAVAGVQPGQTAADVGAGSGFITEGLIRRGLRVIAVDQSEAMLDEMRRKFGAAVDYRRGDAASLPVPDGTVDYAFANMYLHHVESPARAIRELARIIKPGGKLVVTDADEHQFEFLRTEHHDRWLGFRREDVQQWFVEAGLQNVAVDCTGENCCAQSDCGAGQAKISIFVASGEKPTSTSKKGDKVSTATDSERIKAVVREAYGGLARRVAGESARISCCSPQPARSSCCGPAEKVNEASAVARLYPAADLADLPASVTCASAGCGDPIAHADLQPGEVVLDLGSGGGIDCFLAARKVGPTGRVIGLDMTPEMIMLAQRNAKKVGAANVEFRLGEIEDIPLPDQSVDAVISNCVINLSPDKGAVFHEVYRVLRPGGRMTISDIVLDGQLPSVLRENLAAWASCVAGALEESDYLGKIRAAGFDGVEVLSREYMTAEALEQDDVREFLASMGLSPQDVDRKVVSIKVRARKPA